MSEDGAVIIKNFTTPELVDQVNADTRPYLDSDKPWHGAIFPPETRRCTRLVSRSQTVREQWLVSPVVDELTEYFLAKTTSNYYGAEKHTYTTHPILNISVTIETRPGSKAQRLHRDDKNFHVDHIDQTATGYQVGSDVGMGFLIPGVHTTVENGATQVLPGSHLWGMERWPKAENLAFATMQKGDAYCMLGGTYHAGGENTTIDQTRPMHGLFFVRGVMRSEENQYLIHSKEEVLSWSPKVQRIMGFHLSSPNIGFTDFQSPVEFMQGVEREFWVDPDPAFTGALESGTTN
jgi:ectoine hydroxylase-related dioxygenase (phytanoyl-CoA dioxygenase family)